MEPARTDNFELAISEIDTTQKVCERLLNTPHYAKLGKEGIYAIVAKAKSLSVNPLDALNGGLYFVNGKVGMSAEMMASLIRQAGHSIKKDPKSDDTVCILHGTRKDNGDTWMCKFSVDDAKKAGIYRNMWEKYTSIMCYNRCLSTLARQLFPDVIKGAGYTHDELKEIAKNDTSYSPTISFEESTKLQEAEAVEMISLEQVVELKSILKDCEDTYRVNLWSFLKAKNIMNLEQMPVTEYTSIKEKSLANRYQAIADGEKPLEVKEA